MSRRVATITLNPAYDLVGFTPEIERGEVNLVRTTGLHAAGKGINVAKVLKDLGIDVTVGGFLGKDNQDGFQQLFSELGIANRFQVVQGRTRINVKLTEKDGEVTDFNFSGFEVTPGDWERFVNDSLSWLGQFDMVCVSGSLPSGVSPEAFTDWMTRLRSQCPCIIFDSSREALVAGLKAAPWLVKPNRRELEIWAGRKLPEMKDVIDAAHALREQGIAHVVISLGEEGAPIKVAKFGKIIAITWESIVNDDLSALTRIPQALGAAAAQTESDVVWDLLLNNPNFVDGKAVFHADHGNLAAAAGAINTTTLAAARAAMRKQKSKAGHYLNIGPQFLVVGPDKELEAFQFTSSNYVPAKNADINDSRNTSLTVIVDARITGNQWYLYAAPGMVDTFEYAYLEGEQGVFTETREGFEVDGMEIKARLVFGAAWIDYRGAYKNAGA